MGVVPGADGARAVDLVRDRFPAAVLGTGSMHDQHWIEVRAEDLVDVCTWLRDDAECDYDFLVDVTAVHWPDAEMPMELVYHLYSYARDDRLRVKLRTAERGPVPTLTTLWPAADWNEREVWDMYGIEFNGHPNLIRLLCPEEFSSYPLRKYYPQRGRGESDNYPVIRRHN